MQFWEMELSKSYYEKERGRGCHVLIHVLEQKVKKHVYKHSDLKYTNGVSNMILNPQNFPIIVFSAVCCMMFKEARSMASRICIILKQVNLIKNWFLYMQVVRKLKGIKYKNFTE